MGLEEALDHLLKAKRISALSQSYRKDNPLEYQKVVDYLNGGVRPTGVVTEMGLGLVEVEDVRRGELPPPSGLPFSEAVVVNPVRPVIPSSQTGFTCDTGKDYVIDLEMIPRKTLTLTGSPRNVQILNVYSRITDPYGGSGFWRGGINIDLKAEHVSVTNMYTEPTETLTDNITVACKPTTKVTLQRLLLESPKDSREPTAHCDCLQVQGAVGRIEIGLASMFLAGVRPPNHAGKGLQLDILNAIGETGGPFTVDMRKVDFETQGVPASGSRSNIMVGKDDNDKISLTMDEVYGSQGPGGGAFDSWLVNYPGALQKTVTGQAPNRIVTFPGNAQGWAGEFRERPAGTHFVTRSMLGI